MVMGLTNDSWTLFNYCAILVCSHATACLLLSLLLQSLLQEILIQEILNASHGCRAIILAALMSTSCINILMDKVFFATMMWRGCCTMSDLRKRMRRSCGTRDRRWADGFGSCTKGTFRWPRGIVVMVIRLINDSWTLFD